MRLKVPVVSTAVAVISGLVTLFFYFLPPSGGIDLRAMLLQWAVTLAAVALLIGVINLVSVHADKMSSGDANPVYSGILLISLIISFSLVFVLGPGGEAASWMFNYIQVPIEASLMAVLAISLAYASARLLRRRPNVFSMIFIATALLVLLGTNPLVTGRFPVIGDMSGNFRDWIAQVPAMAGARGILLGVALGTIATGLRILMGADRPYSG
ncbi:MAG: hypothetical protein ACE5GO_07570 [Anaerolineales bacterium]